MFKNLQETIKALNADVNNVANSEKAKKLRKKLLSIGKPLMICGFLAAFVCFVLISTAGMNAFDDDGFSARFIVPFVLFLPCAFVGGIGAILVRMAMQIVIAGYTSELIHETLGNACPKCGEIVSDGVNFCPKCGMQIRKECSACQHINGPKNQYCEKCGKELQ